ncbi:bifunctional phosphoglucose/phosphomannose isomerase [soil metagenome]
MDLDDPARFGEVDRSNALADVEATAAQWTAARATAVARADLDGIDVVLVLGMGGSGITGDVVAVLALDTLGVPVIVRRGYGIPGWAGPRTLVLAVSHSGGTEETLSGAEAAFRRGCRVTAITSGGRLGALCDEHGAAWVGVPAGGQPRHSLGWLAVPALGLLGLDGGLDEAVAVQARLAAAWGRDVPAADNPAKKLAQRIAAGAVVVACGGLGVGALAAYRLKCQLNENAELPAFASALPELDHNEVVGWGRPSPLTGAAGIVWFTDAAGEHPGVGRRVEITDGLVRDRVSWTEPVPARGEAKLARLASLVLFADLVSVYTAIALDRDPTPIALIDALKEQLAAADGAGGAV